MATRVWIEDGCISCHACVGTCPSVFVIDQGEAHIRGDARDDGCTDPNRDGRMPLRAEVAAEHEEAIRDAAAGCPIDIIRIA